MALVAAAGSGAPAAAGALAVTLAVLAAIVAAACLSVLAVAPLRRALVVGPGARWARRTGLVPAISETERIALDAGGVGSEADILAGRPDWKRMDALPRPRLDAREQAFLDGPVEEACALVDDWEAWRTGDLPPEAWRFLRERGFFGMVIPREHGGLGFSPSAHAEVVTRLGSRSIPLAVTVMVPSSLGPAELLVRHGTPEQRAHWLPRLARGEEIPCFALTEPGAGSDASSLTSHGVVERAPSGELVLRLTWDKRYITLAPVATVIGLAFRLRDPGGLLGPAEGAGTDGDRGITCALVPASTPGVEIGQRHDPLGVPFLNGPTRGRDVVVPLDAVIGGRDGVGQGWRMLMECLAAGRGVSLPALSVGSIHRAARVAGAHAAVRRQFGLPIGRFEGVEEPLARLAVSAWSMRALQLLTCAELDRGNAPSVASAISKWVQTETSRERVRDAMDVLGGAGIVRGPRNLMAGWHVAQPIGITVEGANILTRTLIVYGQGVMRCHPFARAEADALASGDVVALDRALCGHAWLGLRNALVHVALFASRGLAAWRPGRPAGIVGAWERKAAWACATFATVSDLALVSLGGDLKRRERFAGHLADALAGIHVALAALWRFRQEGSPRDDEPLVDGAARDALAGAQAALERALLGHPSRILGAPLLVAAWLLRLNPIALPLRDRDVSRLARLLQQPGARRERLLDGCVAPRPGSASDVALARLERALEASARADRVHDAVKSAVRSGRIARGEAALDRAAAAGIVSRDDLAIVAAADAARLEAMAVDSHGGATRGVDTSAAAGSRPVDRVASGDPVRDAGPTG